MRGRGAAGSVEWIHAAHDAWSFLPGRPRHDRLLAICPARIVVLDLVSGGGRHRLRSALHLHPDFPSLVDVHWTPLGGRGVAAGAPLHERFNQSREMVEIAVEAEAALPWVGGFVLGLSGVERGWQVGVEEGVIVARAGEPGLELRWRPAGPGRESAVTVRGFEATHGSAT